jgi:hypothetical protein
MALSFRCVITDDRGMDVLMLETDLDRAHAAACKLVAQGHRVWRCHDRGATAFPCRALAGARPCPLDTPGVDVVVTVRKQHCVDPSPYEDGVSCALRARVPLVVVADQGENPFDEYAEEVVADDVTEACERVLARPSPVHTTIATDTLRSALRRRARTDSMPTATVHRTAAGLQVAVDGLGRLDRRTSGLVVSEVVAALRAFDRHAPAIDVSSDRANPGSTTQF